MFDGASRMTMSFEKSIPLKMTRPLLLPCSLLLSLLPCTQLIMSASMDTAVEELTSPAASDAQSLLALASAASTAVSPPPPVDFLPTGVAGESPGKKGALLRTTLLLLTL